MKEIQYPMPVRSQFIQTQPAAEAVTGWSSEMITKFSESINISKNFVLLFLRQVFDIFSNRRIAFVIFVQDYFKHLLLSSSHLEYTAYKLYSQALKKTSKPGTPPDLCHTHYTRRRRTGFTFKLYEKRQKITTNKVLGGLGNAYIGTECGFMLWYGSHKRSDL